MEVPALAVISVSSSSSDEGMPVQDKPNQDQTDFSKHLNDNVDRLKKGSAKAEPVQTEKQKQVTESVVDVDEPNTTAPILVVGNAEDQLLLKLETESGNLASDMLTQRVDAKAVVAEPLVESLIANETVVVDEILPLANEANDPSDTKALSFNPFAELATSKLTPLPIERQFSKTEIADTRSVDPEAVIDSVKSKMLVSDIISEHAQKDQLGQMKLLNQGSSLPTKLVNEVLTPANTTNPEVNINLSSVNLQSNVDSALSTKPTLTLDTPVNNPRWGGELGKTVQWMMSQSMTGAQIRLNPQQLGPIEVRLQIENGQASLAFTAQHGATREALDAALPRLREMMAEQNIDLLDANVSEHSFAEQQQQNTEEHADSIVDEQEKVNLATSPLFDDENQVSKTHDGVFSQFA